MSKETEAIQEAEYTEVEETEVKVKTEVTVRLMENGEVFFLIGGTDHSLINVEGLLGYADRRMKNVWEERLQKEGQ